MKDSATTFTEVLKGNDVKDYKFWDLEIDDIDKFQRRLTVVNKKTGQRDSQVIHLQKLKGKTIINIAVGMVKKLKPAKESRNDQQPRNAEDFFRFAKANKFRIVQEFQDETSQWVVYENPNPNTPQRNETKPEPDYWVTGDALDWQPGYQFNGSRWLIQKIRLEDAERLAIQKAVHEDIKQNQFEFTGSHDPFIEIKKLISEPEYDSVWRLYKSMDGKTKHWVDIISRPAYDRYYYKGEPLYYVTERQVDDKGPKPKNFIITGK